MSTRDESPALKKHICQLCNVSFQRGDALNKHRLKKHTNRIRKVNCECGARFFDHCGLEDHIKRMHTTFTCDKCNFSTSKKKQLVEHQYKQHPFEYDPNPTLKKIYPCEWPGCTRKFSKPYTYRTHYSFHTKPFACTWVDCCKTFGSSILLQGHLNDHKGNRPYCCGNDDCSKSFATKDRLRQHMKLSHIGVKSEKCDWPNCEKTFVHLSRLLVHRRTHTQEKPYPCDIVSCGQAFSTSGSLRSHQQRHHLGRCEACLSAGQSETTAAFIHIRFAAEKLCIVCAQFKYSPEVVFRTEYHLATYIRNRFADHPNVKAIIWNSSDPDDKERCTRFRPDLRILTHTVGDGIIECDENGHKPYQCTMKEIQEAWSELQLTKQSHFERQKIKEDSRLSQLVTSGTIDRTVAWRLNPDRSIDENGDVFAENQAIDSNGNRVIMDLVAARERRFEMLGDEVQAWLDGKWDMSKLPFIYVVYMFYDGPWRQESLVPIDGDEYKIWLQELKSKNRTLAIEKNATE